MRSVFAISILAVFLSAACSVPNLESASCTEARGELKKLYSLHFDRGREAGERYKEERDRFLSEDLADRVEKEDEKDYLTQTADFPKAFRIGGCSESGESGVSFGILLFWKEEGRDEQKEVKASMIKAGDRWLLARVEKAGD